MSKGLDALENIKREVDVPYFSTLYDIDMWVEDITTIEKELKALEIIKNKLLDCDPYLNIIATNCEITKEEYDLLKEVLL